MEQLTQDLLERAKAVVASPKKDYTEMGAVHRAITGTHYACTPCNERRILYYLNQFINQPERYARRIQEAAEEMEEQKQTTNYRFAKSATSKLIVLVTAHGVIKVTPETLTDEKAEAVLKHKQYAHNIERIPGTEEEGETEAEKAAAAEAARLKAIEDAEALAAAEQAKKEQEEAEAAEAARLEAEKAAASSATGLAPNGNVITLTSEELTLDQAQAKYTELTGQKPGSRNLSTLLKAIAEHESK